MLMVLFGLFGLMLDLLFSGIWLLVKLAFSLSPLFLLFYLLRPYRRY